MGVVLSANTVEVGEKLALELLVSCMSAAEDARDVKVRYANVINLVVGFFVNLASVATLALYVVRVFLPSHTKIAHAANAIYVRITSHYGIPTAMIAFYLIRQVPFALMDDHRSPALFVHEVGSKLQKRDRKPRFHLLVPIVFTAVAHTHFSVSSICWAVT